MPFSPADIADALINGLALAEVDLRREQSPIGLDSWKDDAVRGALAAGLVAHGFGAHLGEHYPAAGAIPGARRAHGARCDLVVTSAGRPLSTRCDGDSLFAPADATPAGEALWVEVRTARVYHGEGPNHRYTAELLGAPSDDIVRLGTTPGITHAMFALVLFARTEADGRAHLTEWERAMRCEGLPLDTPRVRSVGITDRIGHGVCMVAVTAVGRIGEAV